MNEVNPVARAPMLGMASRNGAVYPDGDGAHPDARDGFAHRRMEAKRSEAPHRGRCPASRTPPRGR